MGAEETNHILIVDDNELNRTLLQKRLLRQGYRVSLAIHGQEAWHILQELSTIDLVLLDIMMPVMNGYELLALMKGDEALHYIPVIVISAHDAIEEVVRCIEMGAEDYLAKPYHAALLQARIGVSLEKKRLRDGERAYLEELRILHTIDRELNAHLDVTQATRTTLMWALKRAGSDAGLVGRFVPHGMEVVVASGYEDTLDFEQNPLILPLDLPALQAMRDTLPQDSFVGNGGACLLKDGRGQIAYPLRRDDEMIGVLILESYAEVAPGSHLLGFLMRLSERAAVAIGNAQLYQQVEQANIAKTEFMSTVSHELKTPMTSIRGYAQLLQMVGDLNEKQVTWVQAVLHSVIRMERLVADLSEISQIESGHISLDMQPVSLSHVVQESLASIKHLIEEKQHQVDTVLPADLPTVQADPLRVAQVVTNLLSNACKYTPVNGRVRVSAEPTMVDERPMVRVSVLDSGLGIREEQLPYIFDKFTRADDEAVRDAPGTGLGLSITRYLVELHGGQIWVESTYREGSQFHFTLPRA